MIADYSAARLDNLTVDDEAEPAIDEILPSIVWLMRRYCREPSMLLATIIVSRLHRLRERTIDGEIALPEWSCSRSIRNRRYLAVRCRRE